MKPSAENMPDLRPISEIELFVRHSRSPDRRGFAFKLIDAEVQMVSDQSDDGTEGTSIENTVRLWIYCQNLCQS